MAGVWIPGCLARSVTMAAMSVLVLAGTGCDDDRPGPTLPTTPTAPTPSPPPPPSAVSLALTGTVDLTSIGETSQLTATATYSDGTTKDVSAESVWRSGDERVVTISSSGLLTVVGFGRTSISANYANRWANANVRATPPGTFVISGRVREPGQSGLGGAVITDTASGRSTTSDADGSFSIAALAARGARVAVSKEGYEPRTLDATDGTYLDAPLQRVVRVTAGDSVNPPPLAPNDLAYEIGGVQCQPCRMIRIVVPTSGDMEIRVEWQSPASLTLYAEGLTFAGVAGTVSGFVTVPTPRELVVHVGGSVMGHTNFRVTTTRP